MQHDIFDTHFHQAQVNRHKERFATDILLNNALEILDEAVDLFQEAYNKKFSKRLYLDFISATAVEGQHDLITSNLVLHHQNDPIKTLKLYRDVLLPGGVVVATIFGGSTLKELRQILQSTEVELYGGASPRIIPMIDIKDAGRLLHAAGFGQIAVSSWPLTIAYKDFGQMLRHPKFIGQSNCLLQRNRKHVGRDFFKHAERKAVEYFAGAQLSNTFEILTLSAVYS